MFAETWTGGNGDPWNAGRWPIIETIGGAVATIQDNKGRITLPVDTYVRVDSATETRDVDLTYSIELGSTGVQYHNTLFRASAAWSSAFDDDPVNGYSVIVDGESNIFSIRSVVNEFRSHLAHVAKTWGTDPWSIRIQCIGTSIKTKAWQGAEPPAWDIEISNGDHSVGLFKLSFLNVDIAEHVVDLDDLSLDSVSSGTELLSRRSNAERLPATGGAPAAVARIVNRLLDGQSENVGRVTLAPGTTSTVIRSPIFRPTTALILVPLSQAAAPINWWMESAVTDRLAITIGHAAPAGDASFAWIAVG